MQNHEEMADDCQGLA